MTVQELGYRPSVVVDGTEYVLSVALNGKNVKVEAKIIDWDKKPALAAVTPLIKNKVLEAAKL